MSDTRATKYTPETPWLCWCDWPKVQQYKKANPTWVALCTSLRTNPQYRSVWAPYGHAGLGLIADLILLLGEKSVSGIVFGAPEYLQGEMQLGAPPDLSWIVAAGWIRYISLEEKMKIEAELAEPKAKKEKKGPKRPVGRPRKKNNSVTGTGTGTITGTGTETASSGAPARKKSVAAIAAPPETGQPKAQREPQAEPEAQEGPQGPPQRAAPLSLVSSLPPPIPAALGLPAALPPESDALGSGRPKARNPPPASSRSRASPQLLGSCLGPLAVAEQCPEVWDWVSSVYRLLRFPWPINSVEGRRETGSFAAMYNRVMASALPLGKKTEILVSSLKTAEQKGRKPPGYFKKGRGAVFCDILNKRVKTHLARDG